MSDEAFPDSEKLFRNAFAFPDPVPQLLSLIKEHPTFPAVVDLLVYYTCVAEENPFRAEALTSALVAIRDAPDAPNIGNLTLLEAFSRELADLHSRGLVMNKDTKTIGPTNEFLTTSLLSGLSFKYRLTSSAEQYEAMVNGLDVDDSSSISEVLVTGACIQLLTAGSTIIQSPEPYFQSANEIATKLKTQKSAGAVKNMDGLKLLELAITHAETGFQKENDVDNVWEILFAPQT